MPSSTSNSEPRTRWPAGLLIALALVAVLEQAAWSNQRLLSMLARNTPPGPDGDALISAWAVQRLGAEHGPQTPVVLLGSSQVREGLDCDVIGPALGRPCHNLAISAGSPLDMLYLQRRFDGLQPRRTSVLGLFPKVMHIAPKEGFVDTSTLGCVLGSGGWHRIGTRAWVDLSYGLLQRLMPTLRFKDALWAVHHAIGGRWRAAWAGELKAQPERLLTEARPQPPTYFEHALGKVDSDFPELGRFDGSQECALERLLASEAARGNRAVVVDFPTRPGYETTLPLEALAHYARLTARLRARRDIVWLGRGALPALDASDFLDFTHLGPSGRARVSARLAELIAQSTAEIP